MTALVAVLAAVAGVPAGVWVQRTASRFVPARVPVPAGRAAPRSVSARVPPAVPIAATAVLCGLAGLRFGAAWDLPAYLVLAVAGVLLAVIDLEHRLLPTRLIRPALAAGAGLLAVAAAADGAWSALLRGALGAAVLYAFYLVLAFVSPSGLGMGDVRLAAVLGLYLGWLGWSPLLVGAVAGFVVQAVLALFLLAARRIGLRGRLPFGPAMLLGAVLAIGWGAEWADAYLRATGGL
jgi:leader peptidase (prepilin peptidase)/N-methyltransferase